MTLEPFAIASDRMARRLRAVLFVDVVNSVRLIQADEEGTIQRWRSFVNDAMRDDLPAKRGRLVKLLGDGMLVELESAIDAVECAIALQSRIADSEATIPGERRIQLRIGVHLADVIIDDLDLYGDGVNLAARLRDLAGPQEIVISAAIRDQLVDGLDVTIEDLGERELKGVERPVRAFRAWAPGQSLRSGDQRTRRSGDRPSMAVLPFRNSSGHSEHDFLGDLIAEDVIGNLSRQTDLFVISPLSTRPFRDRLYEPRNVADVLGVRYVLSGSMHASAARLRISAELTEAVAGHVVWAERFEGPLADLFELQDQLSQQITKRVVPYVRQIELQRVRAKRPEDLTAYECTLRAIDHLHRSSHEDYERARSLLQSAIKLDPQYVAPRAWLAYWHVRRVGQGWSPDMHADTLDATRHVEAAVELDHKDPWALSVHGLVAAYLFKDLEAAIARYDQALAVNPSAAPAWHWSTSAYAWLGRGDEAVRRAPMAIELSPFDPNMYLFMSHAGSAHAVAGQYEQAIECLRRSLRENRMFTATHKLLTISLALAGRMQAARAAATELLTLEPTFTVSLFRQRYPGSHAPYAEQFFEALRSAGIPA
jgi:TolB-like protein/tetratricopeptide (TPR) repeat protein